MSSDPTRIADAILAMTQARGADKSICPSEVARHLAGPGGTDRDWRPLLGPVRREAVRLAGLGSIDILRHGRPIDPASLRGVVRLRYRPSEPEPATEPPDPAEAPG